MATGFEKSGDAAANTLRAVSGRLQGKKARQVVGFAPGLLEILLAIGIGVVALKLLYALLAPLPTPPTLPDSISSGGPSKAPSTVAAANPFRSAALDAAPPPDAPDSSAQYEETDLDLQLHGVITLEGDQTAIVSTPDGKQGNFRLGEEIWSDVTLERVLSSEQVVILAGAERQTLTLINRDPRDAARNASAANRPPQPAPSTSTAFSLSDIAQISPQITAQGMRLVVQPGPNRGAFNATGLKPGDIIVAVNNRRLGADPAAEARRFAELAKSGRFSLVVERDGVSVPVEIETPGGDG